MGKKEAEHTQTRYDTNPKPQLTKSTIPLVHYGHVSRALPPLLEGHSANSPILAISLGRGGSQPHFTPPHVTLWLKKTPFPSCRQVPRCKNVFNKCLQMVKLVPYIPVTYTQHQCRFEKQSYTPAQVCHSVFVRGAKSLQKELIYIFNQACTLP